MRITSSVTIREFSTLRETQRTQALKCFQIIRPFLKSRVSLTEIARTHQISVRTLRRWVQRYRTSGLTGLIKQTRKDQGRRRSVRPALQQIIEGLALQKPRRTIANIQRETVSISRERNWTQPSYSTIKRIVQKIDPQLTTLAHEGSKAYSEEFDLIYRHQASAPNEVWQSDHSLLPIYVLDEQRKPVKPWLMIILDDYSRAVSGYSLSLASPSASQTEGRRCLNPARCNGCQGNYANWVSVNKLA